MNSRERVIKAINHQEPDRVPVDLGGSIVSSIMAGALVRLRRRLGMDDTVRVYDCFQMLGEVDPDLIDRLGVDLLPVEPEAINFNHLRNRNFKPWRLFDGTPVLISGDFQVETNERGDWVLHEDGDPAKPVLGRMPKGGYYFDDIKVSQVNPDFKPPEMDELRRSNWRRLKESELRYFQEKAHRLRTTTDKAIVLTNWGKSCLGVASVGTMAEWLMLMVSEPGYVGELMDLAAEVALDNLKLYREALGDDIDILHIDGSDFGAQDREMFSPRLFERFHVPCYQKQTAWIHANTPWKIAKHCCGSIPQLIEPMIRAGIDILNPVQTSAHGMDAAGLKQAYGDRMVFWGGGVDTQRIFSFGTPEEVYRDVEQRIKIFAPGGGFIWAAIHNIQYDVPVENILAAFDAVREKGVYPISKEGGK
jgi:uroporphyrinogen-III decarboxylase